MSHQKKLNAGKIAVLALGALGVVYGDIGTSPLYAISEIFFGGSQLAINPSNVLGCISLVLWALTLIVVVKYICFVLRADNDGEGGVFALLSLLKPHKDKFGIAFLVVILTLAAGLLFGDGLITPAISVLSAVEGIAVATPALSPMVVPITIFILTCLFAIQKKGTAKVGLVFGPIVLVWFIVIALLGLKQIVVHPEVFAAINPLYAIEFLWAVPFEKILLVLGAVILVVTGGEALYADMGHFGKRPIRISWFAIVYPCLILSYLGQGAFLLSGSEILNHSIFYSMVPANFLYPVIIIATCATIIASQALISGAFSLVSQAVALGILPRMRILHTHEEHHGQLYVPFINWSLWFGCCFLVWKFESSTALAAAYGLAVAGDMLVNSMAMLALSRYSWRWPLWQAFGLFGAFAVVDLSFLTANSLKFFQGGFVPLTVGLCVFAIMRTWQWGKIKISEAFMIVPRMTIGDFLQLRQNPHTTIIDSSVVFMVSRESKDLEGQVAPIIQLSWNRHRFLPRHIIMLNVEEQKVPYCHDKRYEVVNLFSDAVRGTVSSVVVRFGFMERPDVESVLEGLADHKAINIDEHPKNWLINTVQERVFSGADGGIWEKIRLNFFRILLRNSDSIDKYFGLGNHVSLTTEITAVRIK